MVSILPCVHKWAIESILGGMDEQLRKHCIANCVNCWQTAVIAIETNGRYTFICWANDLPPAEKVL